MFGTVLSKNAQPVLAVLGKSGLVKGAYLAGGSALALHFGHRRSEDFNFFSEKEFDPIALSLSLQKLGTFKGNLAKGISLIGVFNGVKMSYFQYKYPLIGSTTDFLNVKIAHPSDIAAMKLVAIMDRGTKRDFVDLYELYHQGMNWEKLFGLYDKKYHLLEANRFSLLKALGYLDEAEGTTMPEMLKPMTWDEVKTFFSSESIRLGRKYIEGK